MSKISFALIVKNGGEGLRKCLASIHPIADEILIVDTGSTDNSLEIAQQFEAKVFNLKWPDHFAEARNRSLEQCTGDWIFVIDADESLDENSRNEIKHAIQRTNIDGFYILTRNYTNNFLRADFTACRDIEGFSGWTPSHKTRLFRNKPEYRFQGRIHEVIDKSILDAGGRIDECNIIVHHFGGDQCSKEKIDLYKKLTELKVKEDPNNPMGYYELGHIQIAIGEPDQAIQTFKRGAEINPNFGDLRYANFYFEIGNVYFQIKNDIDKALEAYLKAIEIRPGMIYAYSLVGAIYRKKGMPHLAEAYLTEATLLENPTPDTYYNLGLIQLNLKDYKKAIEAFERVIQMAPDYSGAYNNIAVAHHLTGNKNEALSYWRNGLEKNPENKEIRENMKRFGG